MRILMMGTGSFAVPTFRALLAAQHEVLGLITQPQRNIKLGRDEQQLGPMRQAAIDAGVTIHDPLNINTPESIELIRGLQPQLLFVCDYGQILKPAVLQLPALGGINLHGSLLPKYRGAAPVNWAIINGELETGVTVIHMTPRLDAGPILARRTTPIAVDEDAVMVVNRLAELGVEAVMEAIEKLEHWDGTSPIGEAQDPSQIIKAPRLTKADAHLDWSLPAHSIHNRVRGLVPWPGTYTEWTNERGQTQRLIVRRVAVADSPAGGAEPGEVVAASQHQLLVAARDGAVSLLEVQPPGKRVMAIGDFQRGYRLQVGQKFG